MKKLLLSTLALVAIITTSFAQEGFGFGVKAGITSSNVSNLDAKSKIGFTAALAFDYRFAKWFALEADLGYSRLGAKAKEDKTTRLQFDYLHIPLLAKFYVVDGLHLDAGPQFGFKLGAHQKADGERISVGDSFKGFDFSLPIGIGYEIPFGLTVDFRYNIGLSKVYKKEDGYQPNSKNNWLSVTVGWKF